MHNFTNIPAGWTIRSAGESQYQAIGPAEKFLCEPCDAATLQALINRRGGGRPSGCGFRRTVTLSNLTEDQAAFLDSLGNKADFFRLAIDEKMEKRS